MARILVELVITQWLRARGIEDAAALARHVAAMCERALTLEPDLDHQASVKEAIAVLKQHGEPLGMSKEVRDIMLDVSHQNADQD